MPVLNEAGHLAARLDALQSWRELAELIVVDGGSEDESLALAVPRADRAMSAARGRARQQNAGAAAAGGDYLLFLHSDTELGIPPDQFLAELEDRPPWGFFAVRLEGSDWRFRIIERFMGWRSRLSGVATGDQAIFVRRELFESLGGFADIPLMEDVEFSKRLRRVASPRVLRPAVVTSSRRWEQRGVLRTVLLMWELRLRYWLGAPPPDLERRYRG
jgi:rSAM/selenodomain-associated transferase 2